MPVPIAASAASTTAWTRNKASYMATATNTGKRQRSCIACGAQADKTGLLRIVRTPEGAVAFDATGRAPGRGAYVCSAECFAAACKRNKLDRALKATLGSDDYDRIAADVAAHARDAREM